MPHSYRGKCSQGKSIQMGEERWGHCQSAIVENSHSLFFTKATGFSLSATYVGIPLGQRLCYDITTTQHGEQRTLLAKLGMWQLVTGMQLSPHPV